MLIALFTDIHGNREAFEACLDHARRLRAERFVFLGDYVGYGADPRFVVDTVAGLIEEDAIALLGNHDEAIFKAGARMNSLASAAIDWTRRQLDEAQCAFLRARHDGDRLPHDTAGSPSRGCPTAPTTASHCRDATSGIPTDGTGVNSAG